MLEQAAGQSGPRKVAGSKSQRR